MFTIFLFALAVKTNLVPKEEVSCNINDCQTCDTPDNCLNCMPGYGLTKENGKKVCRECIVHSCSECYENYAVCEKCKDSILVNGVCNKCDKGYGFLNGECKPEPENCDAYEIKDNTFICKDNGCINGYYLKDTECTPCTTEFCSRCDATPDVCYQCNDGYDDFTEDGNFVCKKCEKANCMRCSEDVLKCTRCEEGYGFILGENNENTGSCQKCDSNCRDCYENYLICEVCLDQMYNVIDENGKCVPCPEGCNNCNSQCSQCKSNYGFVLDKSGISTGKCQKCMEYCYNCNSDASKCSSCDYDSDLITSGESEKCVLRPINSMRSQDKYVCKDKYGSFIDSKGNPTEICINCPANCSKCTENSNFCTQCVVGYGLVLDKNGENTGICEKCTGFCNNCGEDHTKCTECEYSDEFPDIAFGKEIDENGDFTGNCLPCGDFCDECTEDAKICTSCFYGYRLILDNEGESTGKCGKCSVSNCDYCNKDPDFCTECQSGYDLTLNENGESTGKCHKCPDNCSGCKDPSKCNDSKSCKKGTGPVFDEKGEFTGKCEPCGKNCDMCDSDVKVCSSCSFQYYPIIGPDGEPTSDCEKCPENCECSETSKCTRCKDGYGKQLGQNDEIIGCAKCLDNCVKCSENVQICEICKEGTFAETDENGSITGRCITCGKNCTSCTTDGKHCTNCQPGYVMNVVDGIVQADCVKCSELCSECEIADKTKCITCIDGYRMNDKQKCTKCIDNCKTCNDDTTCSYCMDGYGPNADKKCAKCNDANCKNCQAGIDMCLICQDGFQLVGHKCGKCPENCNDCIYSFDKCSKCSDKYGFEINDSGERTGKCIQCGENCESCVFNSNICEQCEEGFGFEFDASGNRKKNCKKCPEHCSYCSSDANKCIQCDEGFGLILNQDGTSSGKCGACPENCNLCSFDNSVCTSCNAGFGLVKTASGDKKVGECSACPENCEICDIETSSCLMCGQINGKSYGFEIGPDGAIKYTCSKCPSNCEFCYTSNNCIECKEGYDHEEVDYEIYHCVGSGDIGDNDENQNSTSTTPPNVPIECLVDGCEVCEEGKSDQCARCNPPLFLTTNKQCENPLVDITAPPTPKSKGVVPDYDAVENGNLVHDFDKENLGDYKQFILKIDPISEQTKKIDSVTIKNQNNKNILIEIPEDYEEITFKIDDKTENKAFAIIPPSSSSSLAINLDPSTEASIVEAEGEISIQCTDQDKQVNLNQIKPKSDLTITPKSSIKINDIEFDKKNANFIVNSDNNEKVQIGSIKVQQLKSGKIQNATITGNVIMGLSSSLEINEYVKLDKCILDLSYNDQYSQVIEDIAQIKGTINSTPKNLRINTREENVLLSSKKILIAESKEKFDCKSWGDRIEYTKPLNAYECDEKGPYRLYAIQKEDDGGKGKDKLGPGQIAGIVIGVVVFVGLVVFLLVYFLVIKKRNNNKSSDESVNNNSTDL